MKKFIAVVTSMAMAASLMTACGSNAASTETTTAAASERHLRRRLPEKRQRRQSPGQKQTGQLPRSSSHPSCSAVPHPCIRFCHPWHSSFTEKLCDLGCGGFVVSGFQYLVYVAPGGSGVGVSAAIDGTADFGMLARDIRTLRLKPWESITRISWWQRMPLPCRSMLRIQSAASWTDMPVETIARFLQVRLLPGTGGLHACG